MATSGTIGATVVDVSSILEHAFRRAGVDTSKIEGEQQLSAKDNLYFILTDLANDGVNLWCITRQLLGCVVGQATYPLATGTVDLLRAYIRTMSYLAGSTISGATYLGLDTGVPSGNPSTTTVGVTCNAGAQNLVVEYSPDATTWTTAYTIPTFTAVQGNTYWFDIQPQLSMRAWRVRETVAVSIGVTAVQFGNTPSDIRMGMLNRDQYNDLPNKAAPGKPLQYWYDKQIIPQMWVWQVPTDPTQILVAVTHMHVQDVGALTNTLAIPQRWQNYVIWGTAELIANERPKVDRDPATIAYCAAKAADAKRRAEMGESDGSPIRLTPNIHPYTA